MNESDNLHRCPFCGSIGMLDEIKSVTWRCGKSVPVTKYIAQCIIPSCVGHHGKAYVDERTAIDKWNMRDGVKPDKIGDDDLVVENLRVMISSAIGNSRK